MRMQHWWFTAPLRLRSIFRRRRVERELDEELQFHLEHKIEEGMAEGLSRDEARYRALRAMGGLAERKDEIREARRVYWLTDFVDDTRYALRSLRRTPGLTAFVVVAIALGIGMTVTPFSMLDALILRPYPVPRPGDVVTLVGISRDDRFERFSYREYRDIRASTKSYDGVIASGDVMAVGFGADAAATPRVAAGMLVSGNYFQVLGVEPRLGRGFRADEDEIPRRDAVVVLAWEFWKREFAGDPSAVGRAVRINGVDFTVIGIAPETFSGMQLFWRTDLYVPLAMMPVFSTDPPTNFFVDRGSRKLTVSARLKSAVTLERARHELAALARSFERDHPTTSRGRGATVHTRLEMGTRDDDRNWKFGVILAILSLGVLLAACTNAAGLLLSRARTRTREIAVRLAIGAGRNRLIRLLLTESLILACLGGLGGIAVGYAGIRALSGMTIPTELPVEVPFRIDIRVLFASFAMSVLTAVVSGLAPALQSTRADLVNGLKSVDTGRPGRKRAWGRPTLVVLQIAMSLMLLMASFLMIRGFRNILKGGVGFTTQRVLTVKFDPSLLRYDEARTRQFYRLLIERVREAPGVEAAALSKTPPLGLGDFETVAFVPDGVEMPRDRDRFVSAMDTVDEAFFQTMGIPILHGRGFRASDTSESPRVAVVNEQFAKRYWPDRDAVGKRIRLGGVAGEPAEIVGVARTIKYRGPAEKPTEFVYVPQAQHAVVPLVLLLRSSGDALQLVAPLKDIVRSLDPNMPMLATRTYDDLYRYHAVEGPGVAVRLVGALGVIGLLLAVAGLYGLVAYNVARQTREIGIRMAVGARPSDVLGMTIGKGLVLVGIGASLGLAMGFGVERLMNSALFETGGVDLPVYFTVVPAMLVLTTLAAYVPARRAMRIAPTLALRAE